MKLIAIEDTIYRCRDAVERDLTNRIKAIQSDKDAIDFVDYFEAIKPRIKKVGSCYSHFKI